jgi:outer membrane receptor protein involved in Fe transport
VLLAGLVAATAVAQSTTATIRGKVTNDHGGALAGAEVDAVSTSSGFVRTAKAGSDGGFQLAGLTPGEYNIVVAAPAFEARSETMRLLVGQNIEMTFVLSPTTVVNESITVVGNQVVETKSPEIATNITQQQIENLPQDDRNFLNFAGLAPGIRLSTDPQRKTFAGDAQDPERTNIFIDGISTKNDVLQGGTSGQDSSRGNPFPQSAVQEFRVITQNYSAQYDHASSAIITAITKSGGNEFTGQVFTYYQPKAWVAATEKNFQFSTLTTNDTYHRIQPGFNIGGPIIKDHMNFFFSYEGDDEHATKPVTITIPQFVSQFSQYLGTFPAPFRETLGFGKVSWQLSSNQLVDFSGNYRREHETRDFGNQDSFQSATDLRNWVYGGTVRYQWNNSSALNEASVSLQKYGWNPTPLNPNLVGKRYFTPNFATIIRTGGNTTTQDFDQRRLELRDNYNFAPIAMRGTHNFQVGGNVDYMHYNVNKSLNGNPEFHFLPDANGVFNDIPFEADFGIGNPILKISNNEYGIYGQDNWQVNSHLQLNLGLRWDYETHMLDQDYVTPANIVAGLKGKSFQFDNRTITIPDEYFSTGSERKPYKNQYQPRFGFSYDIAGNSKSVVFGGWGKYYDRLFLNSTLDERFRLQFPVYRFHFSPNGDPGTVKWDPSYFTIPGLQTLIAQGAARPEVYLLSNNTKVPYSNQYNIGYRQAFGDWLASASYNAVRGKHGITYVSASGTCCAAFVPGFGNIIINDPVGKSFWYDAESLTLDRPFTTNGPLHWSARFIYTHAKSEQNGNDLFSLDLPSAAAYAKHPIPGSEPNHFVASGIVGLPWDVRFSTTLTYGSGGANPVFDFSQGFDFAGRLKTGVLNRAVYPPGHYKNADFALQKDFRSFGKSSITGILQVFNAFNNTNYGCLSNFQAPDTNPATLGTANCVVTLGRREQVGIKVSF